MHVDETSLRIDQKNHWIHVYAAGDFAPPDAQDKAARESALLVILLRSHGCNPKLDKQAVSLRWQRLRLEYIVSPIEFYSGAGRGCVVCSACAVGIGKTAENAYGKCLLSQFIQGRYTLRQCARAHRDKQILA